MTKRTKQIFLIIFLYIALLFQLRHIVAFHRGFLPPNLTIPHKLYNHTGNPNLSITFKEQMPENHPVSYKINSQGLRENNTIEIPKPKGLYRILVVGDSFVMGINEQISVIVERELTNTFQGMGTAFEVINAGIGSYSPSIHLARLKHQFLSFDPDAIIYFPDLTDVQNDSHMYKSMIKYEKNGNLKRVARSIGLTVRVRNIKTLIKNYLDLYGIWESPDRNILRDSKPGSYKGFEHSREDENNLSKFTVAEIQFTIDFIDEYIQVAKSKGIHLSFAMYPHLYQIIPENQAIKSTSNKIHNRAFEKRVKRLAKKNGLVFKSFFEKIKTHVLAEEKIYFLNDMHFNDPGMALLGGYVASWILSDPENTIGYKPNRQTQLD
tara:strand:+ start:696 stop:1832 length:1137 start_codon:yes stop_codon:yes gene_type:complete